MRWRRFLKRSWWDQERAREIASYIEIETADNIARGMPPAEAASDARRKFGNPLLVREEIYRMNSLAWLENTWQDLRYGARMLRLSPGFTLVALASLALGIGANTAIFQLLDAVRLRSLPVSNPSELVEVRIAGGSHGLGLNNGHYSHLTRPVWQQIRDQHQAFSGAFAWRLGQEEVGQGSQLRHVNGLWVTGDFFQVLGVHPWRGRLLQSEDERACPGSVAVVSYPYWQRELGGRELGPDSKLLVNGALTRIIGVTPPGFFGLAVGDSFDIALPFCSPNSELRRDFFDVAVVGRLAPGWSIERASAYLDTISPGIFEATQITGYRTEDIDRYRHFRLAAFPAASGVSALRDQYDSPLWLLLGITGLVLLIACANLANLMLARGSAREREIAVRLALGASRNRLLRQFLTESGLLALLGASAGIALAQILSRILVASFSPGDEPLKLEITTDWRVLAFVAAVAGLTCLIFGALPALRVTRVQAGGAMKGAARGMTAARGRFGLQRLMVVTQIAVSLLLLAGAILFVRSFRNLMTLNPGMREDGITVAFVQFVHSNVPPERTEEFKRQLLDQVRSSPGVLNAATTTMVPLIGGSWGHHIHVGAVEGGSQFTWVSPGYFQTLGIDLLAGRDFNQKDTANAPRVAVVNQTFVRQFLAGEDPLGKSLRTDAEPNYPSTVYQIVGVIADTKYDDVRGETPAMAFAPAAQFPPRT
ncbi:MAG TPA: ABC transporter permease, partial [Blastocatellia bacterium]|nr:ABC transporter permease [Blastocatellia bacterium]